jgi:PadR family transcriptional regulator, regulatory protein AphA
MSLNYSILGFLNLGAMTGYELKKAIDSSTQFFWHAELSQIYPTLKQLEKKHWVAVKVIPQTGKPDKKLYAITEEGRFELVRWLKEPLDESQPVKSPILLKLFFMGELSPSELIAQLRCQLEVQRARLKRFQLDSPQQIADATLSVEQDLNATLWELLRQYGEQQTQTSIEWMESAIKNIEGTHENSGD